MPGAEDGGIFVSYRRQDSAHLAGRLYDRLTDRFGEGQVFIDVDTIELGVDFAEEISRAVAACKVLLAVFGPTWLTSTDERGRRRLDDPDDIVRLEIEAAFARDVRMIPILVEGAVMPGRQDLPESLAGLARRNALLIRHESFRYDPTDCSRRSSGCWRQHPAGVGPRGAGLTSHGTGTIGTSRSASTTGGVTGRMRASSASFPLAVSPGTPRPFAASRSALESSRTSRRRGM
jgi:TIR domain